MVFHVGFEMAGQVIDAGSKQSHLHFWGAGIGSGALIVLNDLRFLGNSNSHGVLLMNRVACGWAGHVLENQRFYPKNTIKFKSRLRY
jgi:hypothetical protein